MKKYLLYLLTSSSLFALPVGNPKEPALMCKGLFFCSDFGHSCDPCLDWIDTFSYRLGFYGDYVFDRELEVENDFSNQNRDLENFSIYTNALYLALNIWDILDIFGTVGASTSSLLSNASAFGGPAGNQLELETTPEFSWSAGFRAAAYTLCGFTLGFEGQYFRYRPNVRRISEAATISVYSNEEVIYHEWQVGSGIAYQLFPRFTPYVGVKWSKAIFNFDNFNVDLGAVTHHFHSLASRKHWGYAVGCSLLDCAVALATIEARLGDEKALYANLQLRF